MEGLVRKFKGARDKLLVLIVTTIISVALTVLNVFISYFSLFAPIFAIFLLENVGIIIAGCMILMYLLCYFLSKKYKVLMLVALILFIVDTLILLAFVLYTLEVQSKYVLIDIAFHAFILYYLINGVVAWDKMRKAPTEEVVEAESILKKETTYRYRVLMEEDEEKIEE